MRNRFKTLQRLLLLSSAIVVGGPLVTGTAFAEDKRVFIFSPKDLAVALQEFTYATGRDLVFSSELVKGKMANAVSGTYSDEEALNRLLLGTGVGFERTPSDAIILRSRPEKLI